MAVNDKLPIDVVPGMHPPRFHWRQTVRAYDGPRTIEHEGPAPVHMEESLVALIDVAKQLQRNSETDGERDRLLEDIKRLQAFKDWVHAYLDAQGVPKEFPNGSHTKEGCRIGDRMDWLVKALSGSSAEDALRAENAALLVELETCRKRAAPAASHK